MSPIAWVAHLNEVGALAQEAPPKPHAFTESMVSEKLLVASRPTSLSSLRWATLRFRAHFAFKILKIFHGVRLLHRPLSELIACGIRLFRISNCSTAAFALPGIASTSRLRET